uniref:Carboxypeptidase n=1 Tax=Bursaphelenchus xylophilus TaxID=6326 RepID=A0A1I7SDW1_BURXY
MFLKAVILGICVNSCLAGVKEDHEVKSLPWLDWQLNFKHYSGWLNVSKTRSLSYWFVESQNDKAKDPLLLWLTGGPGCSSFYGLLQENGPFVLAEGDDIELKLLENPNAWNNFANVIYLESPAGVGFSQNDDETYVYNDNNTAVDNANFLIAFLEEYPEYKGRDFYISGESYAGCYIPTLANQILSIKDKLSLNLKGVAIGNGVTVVEETLRFGAANFNFHGAGATVYELGKWMRDNCPSGFDNFCKGEKVPIDRERLDEFSLIYQQLLATPSKPNPYDINRPCYSGVACTGNGISKYLNQVEVQRALHFLPQSGEAVEWNTCSGINAIYRWCDDMTGDITNVLANNIKVLYFYGETDTMCSFIAADLFVHKIGKNPNTDTWFVDDLYAGTKTTFDGNLTYTTIADCGHMAAMWKPKQTARAVHHFINDISDWNN